MTYAGAPVSWRSATGGRNDSTTRSELEAATEAARRIPTIKGVLNDMGRKQGRTKLFVDNAAVVFICQKKFSTKKCQYVMKKQMLCREAHHREEGHPEAIQVEDI